MACQSVLGKRPFHEISKEGLNISRDVLVKKVCPYLPPKDLAALCSIGQEFRGLKTRFFQEVKRIEIPRELSCHKALELFSQLEALKISRGDQVGTILDAAPLSIRSLDLSHNGDLKGKDLKKLRRFPLLEQLSLSCCLGLKNGDLEHLKGLGLKHLDLSANESWLIERGLFHLEQLPLISLKLHATSPQNRFNQQAIARIKQTTLERLDLSGWGQLEGEDLQNIASLRLQSLSLAQAKITDESLAYLEDMPLEVLDLRDCGNVTKAGLKYLMKLPLKRLNLQGTRVKKQEVEQAWKHHPEGVVSCSSQ